MAEVGFEIEIIDAVDGDRGQTPILSALVFDEDQFRKIKQANERGTLRVRTIITETKRREV